MIINFLKKNYIWIIIIAILIGIICFSEPKNNSESNNENNKKEMSFPQQIPNVFGVNYKDAIDVLESEGFIVKAVEADAKSIYDGLSFGDPIDVVKGNVFKIDDYILNGFGDLVQNNAPRAKMKTNDINIVIYYAKNDYLIDEDETEEIYSEAEEKISFEILNGELGQYGQSRTINANTEFEESILEYHIPSGTYTVTNKSKEETCQISIYSNEYTKVDGWDEPMETYGAEVIAPNESVSITITDGQHISISDGSAKILFEEQ